MHLFWEKGLWLDFRRGHPRPRRRQQREPLPLLPGQAGLCLSRVLDCVSTASGSMLLEPAWRGTTDPIEKIWKLMDAYRQALVQTECTYGCPIGSLALELHEPDPVVRERLAKNFTNWTAAIEECLDRRGQPRAGRRRQARARGIRADDDGRRRDAGRKATATSATSTAPSASSKGHFNRLLRPAKSPARRRPQRRKKGKIHA